ncbi:MAG TPA: DUF5818 domain-containing protein [Terriglobales bacterium]
MSKRTHPLWPLAMLALFAGLVFTGIQLRAQDTSQTPDQQTSPSQPSAQQPSQPPDTQAPSSQQPSEQPGTQQQPSTSPDASASQSPDAVQTFMGTVVKAGDKYVLQDTSGKSYDLDNQDLVKSYEGKQVRVKGTLDPDGKTIHIK